MTSLLMDPAAEAAGALADREEVPLPARHPAPAPPDRARRPPARPRPGPGGRLAAVGEFPLPAADPSLVYLDSAATAQKPRAVLDALRGYYETTNANPHRRADRRRSEERRG